MDESEFDRFADEYRQLHAANITASGESPEYFAEYKIRDVADALGRSDRNNVIQVLDFGAGIGGSIPYFRKYLPGAQLTCLDVSQKSLDVGRARFRNEASFVHFDGRDIPFDPGSFDLAFAACAFHHIPTTKHSQLISELARVLRKPGDLFIFEHNPYNPLTVRAVKDCPFDENAKLIPARRLAAQVGAIMDARVSVRYRVFFPGFARALRPLERALTWLPIGAQYYVHARVA